VRAFVRLLAAHPRLTALLGAISISFSGILYRLAEVSPETGTFFRAFYGLPILLLAGYAERRVRGPMSRRAVALAGFAGILFAADLLTWHHAIEAVGAGLATVLGNLQVVVVAILAWLIFGERPSQRTLLALPVILAGVVLIAGVLGGDSYGADPLLGVFLGVLTALSYGGYLIVIRHVGRRLSAGPVAISTTSTAIVALAIGLALGTIDLLPSWPAHMWLILLGVSAQSAGYLFISLSLPRLPAVVTSIILLAQPVLAVLLAMLLISETPSLLQLLGVALVVCGIALATVPLAALRNRLRPVTTP
jgi:drug/metabolite transporter (DMT)-like permease